MCYVQLIFTECFFFKMKQKFFFLAYIITVLGKLLRPTLCYLLCCKYVHSLQYMIRMHIWASVLGGDKLKPCKPLYVEKRYWLFHLKQASAFQMKMFKLVFALKHVWCCACNFYKGCHPNGMVFNYTVFQFTQFHFNYTTTELNKIQSTDGPLQSWLASG